MQGTSVSCGIFMIISFIGTNKGNNHCKRAAATLGGLLSLSNNKKVCVIQICNSEMGIEHLMMGKTYERNAINALNIGVDETGIDGMIRKASSAKLSKDDYVAACKAMLNSENRLDILGVSRTKNFMELIPTENRTELIKTIIHDAEKFYKYVIVVLPNDPDVAGRFITESDINVCCVRQADHEEPYLNDKKNVFLVPDFDPESKYTLKEIRKAYHDDDPKAKIFAMPYNIQFRDACYSRELLRWMYKNYNADINDFNFTFIDKMQKFADFVSDTVKDDGEEEGDDTTIIVERKKKSLKERMRK